MNPETTAVLVLFGGLTAAIAWRRWLRRRVPDLPEELRFAKLIYGEQLFRSLSPLPINARVDRVYQVATGDLVLVELKTRTHPRVYRSDVIELSAQRIALVGHLSANVARQAYVLSEQPDGRGARWHRVGLLGHDEVAALVERRAQLLAGNAIPQLTQMYGMCRKCARAQLCHPEQSMSVASAGLANL